MICWLSLGRWFNSGSKEIGFNFGIHVSIFFDFVSPDKKKPVYKNPNLSCNEKCVFHIRHFMPIRDHLTPKWFDHATFWSAVRRSYCCTTRSLKKGGASWVGPLMHLPQNAARFPLKISKVRFSEFLGQLLWLEVFPSFDISAGRAEHCGWSVGYP